MNPYCERTNLLICGAMSVQFDFQVTHLFVGVGGDGGFLFLGMGGAGAEENAKEKPQQGRAAMHGNGF